MESKRNTRSTKLSKWAESATDAQWEVLEKDLIEFSAQPDGDQAFNKKYEFSISGIKPYLEIHKAKAEIRAEYERKLQEALASNKVEESVDTVITYKKPTTPYKKVTLTLTEEAYNELMKTAARLSDEYGYEKRYCMSTMILDVCKKYNK